MSYHHLADMLEQLADNLRRAESLLSGTVTASVAKKLEASAKSMDKIVRKSLSLSDPATHALSLFFQNHADIFDTKTTVALGKNLFDKAFRPKKTETASDTRSRLLEIAIEQGATEDLLQAAQKWMTQLALKHPDPSDEKALRAELCRLGSLSTLEQTMELDLRIPIPIQKALAQQAGFKGTVKGITGKKRIEFLAFCHRLHENTTWRTH